MVGIHLPQERQDDLVSQDKFPPRLFDLVSGEIVLKHVVFSDLSDEPLLGVQ